MGYDTTLHLVEDTSFALGEKAVTDPAPDDETAREVAALLSTNRPEGERLLAQLLLAHVSAHAPYLASRNAALSLWDEEVMGVALPEHLIGALEDKLPTLRSRFPGLALPRGFAGNGTTGIYVSVEHVPAVFAVLETALGGMPPAQAWSFRHLRRVLAVAAERGMGYWEGTECAVVTEPPHPEWLEPPRPAGVRVETCDLGLLFSPPLARASSRLMVSDARVLLRVAIDAFPPKVEASDEDCTTACYTPWDSDIVYIEDERVPGAQIGFEFMAGGKSVVHDIPHIGALRCVGDAVVALPGATAPTSATPQLITKKWSGGRKVSPLAVPTKHAGASHAAIPFGDGSFLLIWNDQPFQVKGGNLRPLGEPLHATDDVNAAATLDDGSIVGTFNDSLMRITPGGQRQTIAGIAEPIEVIRAADALVIRERSDHLLRVWWWATGDLATLEPRDVGIEEEVDLCYFCAPEQLLVLAARGRVYGIPWQFVLARPRTRMTACL